MASSEKKSPEKKSSGKKTAAKRGSKSNSNESKGLSIEEQTAIFLSAGGKIQEIPTGVSGQTNLSGPKHITLGNKNTDNSASNATKS